MCIFLFKDNKEGKYFTWSQKGKGGNIKREKILDMTKKMRLNKRKTRKISSRRKKNAQTWKSQIDLIPPYLQWGNGCSFLRFYQGLPGLGSLAIPQGEVGCFRALSLWGGCGLSYKLWSGRHSGSRWEADKERTTDQHLKPYWEI